MIFSNFITRVNYVLRGIDDDTPESGDSEWNQWLDATNLVKNVLYENTSQDWSSIHETTSPNEPGTVATTGTTTLTGTSTFFTDYKAGDTVTVSGETSRIIDTITSDTVLTVTVAFTNTDSALTFTRGMIVAAANTEHNLHRSFINPSSNVTITHTDGKLTYYDLIKPQEADSGARNIYIEGQYPKTAVFTDTIGSTENIVGGVLTIPGYYMPDDITTGTDIVPVPDANWAVYAVASEIAFNDITYEDKAPDLNVKANNLYAQMMNKNRKGTYNNPRVTPTNVYRIRSR